jgi:hypothetical protein
MLLYAQSDRFAPQTRRAPPDWRGEGEVAEWSKAPVSKTGVPKGTESSNLSLSALSI